MAWSTIRKATADDRDAIEAAAERFIKRHGIKTWSDEPASSTVDNHIDGLSQKDRVDGGERGRYLGRLWRAAVRRALNERHADGIAYGYVGFHVD